MTSYIETFLDDTTADLRGQITDEQLALMRETMTPFIPLVLKHALRLSDARLTAFAQDSGGWVNYCYTGADGMIIKLLYPSVQTVDRSLTPPPGKPDSYNVPYSIFFSDQDMAAWRGAKDAEFAAAAQQALDDAAAVRTAAAQAAKREYDIAMLQDLIAQYGIPQ